MMNNLNVGSGLDIRQDYENLDMHDNNGADHIFDLNNIFKGVLLPFKDNQFNIVLCSHVLEDFCDPMPIMDELVRVSNHFIKIRVPADTNLLQSNMLHKHQFTIFKLLSYITHSKDYYNKVNLKIHSFRYYSYGNTRYENFCAFMRNLIGYRVIESTILKHIFPMVDIEIIYVKNGI